LSKAQRSGYFKTYFLDWCVKGARIIANTMIFFWKDFFYFIAYHTFLILPNPKEEELFEICEIAFI
jgi:hypothetical protein